MLEDVKTWDVEAVQKMLHETVCKVVFMKTNGEERVIHCTLNETMIPAQSENADTPKRAKKHNPEVQAIYDVEAQGWKSFRWDLLKDFQSEMNL